MSRSLVLWMLFQGDVAALGCDDYAVREAAEARLTRWADVAWPLLDRPFTDPEQRRRARRILSQTVPSCCPPVAFLSGRPVLEWELDGTCRRSVGVRPGPEWRLAWQRPDGRAPLGWMVKYYGERARTQYVWPDWHGDADGREATRLFTRDLLAVGVPPWLVRELVGKMGALEERALAGLSP